MAPRAEIVLTDEEREVLERWARRPKTSQALALRCRIVLTAADGEQSKDIAARLGCTPSTGATTRSSPTSTATPPRRRGLRAGQRDRHRCGEEPPEEPGERRRPAHRRPPVPCGRRRATSGYVGRRPARGGVQRQGRTGPPDRGRNPAGEGSRSWSRATRGNEELKGISG